MTDEKLEQIIDAFESLPPERRSQLALVAPRLYHSISRELIERQLQQERDEALFRASWLGRFLQWRANRRAARATYTRENPPHA